MDIEIETSQLEIEPVVMWTAFEQILSDFFLEKYKKNAEWVAQDASNNKKLSRHYTLQMVILDDWASAGRHLYNEILGFIENSRLSEDEDVRKRASTLR